MSDNSRTILRTAVRSLMMPLVRFCIRHSFRVQELEDMLKSVLLEVGEQELGRRDVAPNVSRLSALTGLHRRDVRRLWKHEVAPRTDADVIARVIGQWQSDRRYCTAGGRPRVLSFHGGKGEFDDLVKLVSADLNPYTVLFELERTGAVEAGEDTVKLRKTSLGVAKDIKRGMEVLAADSGDLIEAISENVFHDPEQPNLHIRTEYTNVPAEHAERLRVWLIKRGAEFHAAARDYLSRFDRDITPGVESRNGETVRIALTAFSRIEQLRTESPGKAPEPEVTLSRPRRSRRYSPRV